MVRLEKIGIRELEFDCRISGDESKALVLFLHGFPETSFMWIDCIQSISKLGFYCVAPNMRGYSENARPKGKKHYTIEKLSQDILDLAAALGKKRFHLVAHDWGAAIAWKLVYEHSDVILSYTALSVPHLKAFSKAILTDKIQQKKSQYIKNFQIPFLPEMKIRKNDFKLFRKLWKHSSEEEVNYNLSVFRKKYCLTAAINYYRANSKIFLKNLIGEIEVPTLFIWGENDLAIGKVGVDNSHKYMKGYYKFVQLNAGHWLIQTHYDTLLDEISEHLLKFKNN